MNKIFLDVRSSNDFKIDGIEESINIPHNTIINNLEKIPKDSRVFVYCNSGETSNLISSVLEKLGYDVVNIKTIKAARNIINAKSKT